MMMPIRKTMKTSPFQLLTIFISSYGPQYWWPMDQSHHKKNGSDPRFEVIIGAILTQNTAWSNVEKAIVNLKQADMLDILAVVNCDVETLKQLIRPSGFFNQKAQRLKTMALHLKDTYDSNLDLFFDQDLQSLRKELLQLNGIGPETADSILLYAGDKPIFVVDAYTKRLFGRLNLLTDLSYDSIQIYVESDFSHKFPEAQLPQMYNEFHALIVEHAKRFCRKKPNCSGCPVFEYCNYPNGALE
jgi:endonuclease III related protein